MGKIINVISFCQGLCRPEVLSLAIYRCFLGMYQDAVLL